MLICIGKIEKDNRMIEACKVIDSISKEVRIISINKVKNILNSGVPIKGFILVEPTKYYGNTEKILKRENTNQFKFSRVPKINGAGELIDPEDEKILTVYAWEGFAELKRYHLFNYKGETIILSKQEFEEKVQKREVNGACISNKTGKVIMTECLNVEIS